MHLHVGRVACTPNPSWCATRCWHQNGLHGRPLAPAGRPKAVHQKGAAALRPRGAEAGRRDRVPTPELSCAAHAHQGPLLAPMR